MLKKSLIVAGAAALLMGLLFGRSHIKTTLGLVKDQVKNSVPIDFEIERARQMIVELEPEIERNLRRIAQEEVEVAKLEEKLSAKEDRLAKSRVDILRLKKDLDSGSEVFVYAGRSYSPREVKADLTARFAEFKTEEETAASLHKILVARQTSLKAAREKLDSMFDAKRQLQVDIENLEARLKMVEVAQATSNFKFDDSQLSRTQKLVENIGTRIEVAERLVNADVHYFDRIPLDEAEASDREITDEVADYFGQGREDVEAYVRSLE